VLPEALYAGLGALPPQQEGAAPGMAAGFSSIGAESSRVLL